jgi:hypothetical protein
MRFVIGDLQQLRYDRGAPPPLIGFDRRGEQNGRLGER